MAGPSSTSASRAPSGAPRDGLSARGLALVLAALAVGLVAADRLGGMALERAYRATAASPVDRILASRAQVLVLGSSVSKYAIDPAYFLANSYNAAANGQGLFYAAAVLRNLPREAPVRRVVLGFDPGEFHSGYRDANFKHLARLAPLARADPWLREQIGRSDSWAWLKNLSHLYFYRGTVPEIVKRALRPEKPGRGFEPLVGVRHDSDPPPVADGGAAQTVAPEALEALDRILAAAAARDIQVVAVVIPVWGRARERAAAFAGIMAAIRGRLAAAGMCDLTAGDSPALDAIRADGSLFFDGPHMNTLGARRYSRALAREITAACR